MALENKIKKAFSIDNISKNIDGLLNIANRVILAAQPASELIKSLKPGSNVGPMASENTTQQGLAADQSGSKTSAIILLALGVIVLFFVLKKK